jgi:predicted nucleic acid-binding protein
VIVVDTSVIVDVFLLESHAIEFRKLLLEHQLRAPDHIYSEVLSVLRRLERHDVVSSVFAERCIVALVELDLTTHSLKTMTSETWGLRHNISPYDAPFVVLASKLDCPLLTHDEKLVKAAADHIEIRRLLPAAP